MSYIQKFRVSNGIYLLSIPEAELNILCGCPADSVKHLMKKGLILIKENEEKFWETGPNAILLSDVSVQNGSFSNLAEFPVLQMLYRQGMIVPNHPNNRGVKPILIGSKQQVHSQMQYIYCGNYGLTELKELIESGIDENTAEELYRIKLRFAFGRISKTEELLNGITVDKDEVEIKNKTYIKRLEINSFQISYKNESVKIDLNLKPSEKYECPYKLGYYCPERKYFAVKHTGEGDGWDVNRPAMASILMFQGKYYLIDCGPHIDYTLNQLGISVSEIEGIFHTHCHDDHFNGLTTLIRSDHKIKYFSEASVAKTVKRKLSYLIGKSESEFENFFETVELKLDEWNNIDSLEVKPVCSPHPVETTILFFRAQGGSEYKTYGHLADITDLKILSKMTEPLGELKGFSKNFFDKIKTGYLTKCDLKKIDAGGGLIHGNAADFKNDASDKIILAHTSKELSSLEKEIGSGATFGMTDELLPNFSEYDRLQAYKYLTEIFPEIEKHKTAILLNNEIKTYNPGTIVMKSNSAREYIHLVLSGNLEAIFENAKFVRTLSPGSFAGNIFSGDSGETDMTYRTVSYVKTLNIPLKLFERFLVQNKLSEKMKLNNYTINFMNCVYLFGDSLSYPVQNRIAEKMKLVNFSKGHTFNVSQPGVLYLLKKGKVKLFINGADIEILEPGGFWNASSVLFGLSTIFNAETLEDSDIYLIPEEILSNVPVIRWKLMEEYDRRLKKIVNMPEVSLNLFRWEETYSTGDSKMDEQHKRLIEQASEISDKIITSRLEFNSEKISKLLSFIIDYTKTHFVDEEELMKKICFPEYEEHCKKHIELIEAVNKFAERLDKNDMYMEIDFLTFLKTWVIDHIINDDRKYSKYIRR